MPKGFACALVPIGDEPGDVACICVAWCAPITLAPAPAEASALELTTSKPDQAYYS